MKQIDYPSLHETIYEEILPNGLKVLVAQKPGFSRAHAMFATRYGGTDRRFRLNGQWLDTPAGIAHFLEHKMFDMPDGSDALMTLSAAGAAPNAYTSGDTTAYYFTCTKNFQDNLRTLLDYVSTPYYTEASVQKEQGIIGQEIRMTEDNPGYAGYIELLKALYAHHPVRDGVAGTVESIAKITAETLYSCHKVFYNPGNMVLCVSGDVDPEQICSIAKEILPQEAGEVPERDYGEPELLTPYKMFTEKAMEVSAPQFLIGSKLPDVGPGRERLRQMILSELALDYLVGSSSPYYTSLYAQGVLRGDFGAEVDDCANTRTLLIGGESKDYQKAKDALLEEVKKIGSTGMEETRFERCKRAFFGGALSGLDSVETAASMLLDGAFHGFYGMDMFDLYNSITSAEAAEFIRENLAEERLAMSVIQPI